MRRIKESIIIILLMLILSILFKQYLISLELIISMIILINKLKLVPFEDTLLKLQKANQVYVSKEEKLKYVFGPSDQSYEESCQLIRSKAKTRLERSFYQELCLCNNKTQIDRVIKIYLISFKNNHFILLLDSLMIEFAILAFSPIATKSIILILNIYLIVVLLLYFFSLLLSEKVINKQNLIYLKFFARLQYTTPMICLKETIDQYQLEGTIYNTMYEDVIENKVSTYPKKYDLLVSALFKILCNNKYNDEPILIEKYQSIIENRGSIFRFIEDYHTVIFVLVIVCYITLL